MKLPILNYNGKPALPPQKDDLRRLYKLITENMCLTVLEFGCGYSTFVIAEALKENRRKWDALENKPEVRNSNMFWSISVDTNSEWITEVQTKLGQDRYIIIYSSCRAGTYQDQMCHYYDFLPNIVPDFIYIDGPDPKQVEGDVNGLTFQCSERTPMSADLLLMEPTLIPGTMVLIDGRTNNARFLQNNLKRKWTVPYNSGDYMIMYLEESRLGNINAVGRDICKEFQTKK